RDGAPGLLAAPGRRADLRRPAAVQARARDPAYLRPDAAAQVGDLDGGLRLDRRHFRQLRDGAGDRHDRPRGRVRPRVPAAARGTIVVVARERLAEVMRWLRDTPAHTYDYLVDVTAVEYRDRERSIEVVYFLRSLERRADLRVKVELDPRGELAVDSVTPLWAGGDWLEREVYDMFGVTFRGHPDLRRILMWETYAEGYPLRKDFPL